MNPLILIIFLHLLFGFWFSYQIYLHRSSSVFSNSTIYLCLFLYFTILLLSSQTNLFGFILGIYLPLFFYIFTECIYFYQRSLIFQNYFLQLVNSIITRIKMGNGFRKAFELSLSTLPSPFPQNIFNEIQNRIIYSQNLPKNTSSHIKFAFKHLKKAEEDPQPLLRLSYLKHSLQVENDFRKKSRKALLQVHIQSFIMTGLFISLFIFTFLFYGTEFLSIALLASFLFLLGTGIVFLVGRRIKWTL